MNTEPKIGHYLDEEEQALIGAIEHDDSTLGQSVLDDARRKTLQAAARATMNEERARISLRVPKSDLARLKARAMREGVPYQTLINSLLHKAVTE